MNFIDAVQALEDGRCEGVRRECWCDSVYFHILDNNWIYRKTDDNSYSDLHFGTETYLATDWELVGEKPQTETVEVVQEWCTACDLHVANCYCHEDDQQIIELRGSYQRPVRPKVKQRSTA